MQSAVKQGDRKHIKRREQEYGLSEFRDFLPGDDRWTIRDSRAGTLLGIFRGLEETNEHKAACLATLKLLREMVKLPGSPTNKAAFWRRSLEEAADDVIRLSFSATCLALEADKAMWLDVIKKYPEGMEEHQEQWLWVIQQSSKAHTFTRLELVPVVGRTDPDINALGLKLMASASKPSRPAPLSEPV